MSAEATAPTAEISDQDVQDALVSLYSLSNDAVESIDKLSQSLKLRFADAAVHTGLISQEQLDNALDWIRRRAGQEGESIVEQVLRRNVSKRRELVLWEGPKLRPSERLIVAHDM